jgi:bis(5'-nucleosidyl)-tetraphosphatase
MPVEKSVGAVVLRKEGNKIYYLLLYYPSVSHRAERNYWDFPKGHIKRGEKPEITAIREVKEETGLKEIALVGGFKETIRYFFKFKGKNILKFATFYLVETKSKAVKISYEHIGFKWLPYKEALEQLAFKNAKEVLQKANNFLSGKSIRGG